MANVASPRRRGPADNICHGPRATLIRHCPICQHKCFLPSNVCAVVDNEYVVSQSRNPLCPGYPLLTLKRWAMAWLVEIAVCSGRCRHCRSRLDKFAYYDTFTSTAFRSCVTGVSGHCLVSILVTKCRV